MKSTSILKKKMSKKHGSFILKQSSKNFDNYVIDVCVNQRYLYIYNLYTIIIN